MVFFFADYTPTLERMIPALILQLAILGALAAALIAYNRQFATWLRCLTAVLGPGILGVALFLGIGIWANGFGAEFVIAFFELYYFATVAACLMTFGGLVLAVASWATTGDREPPRQASD